MRFDVDWLADGPNAVPEERATIADLVISIGGRNACENEQPRRRGKGGRGSNVRPATAATVSVYPLAEEIAFNWWRLFGDRDTELQLVDGRGGYAVPDVRLAYDGAQFEARCEPIEYENPKVRFTVPCGERSTRAQAEAALTGFVERVVAQLAAEGMRESGLQLRWARVQASRRNAEESAFCEAAGALGIDPYGVAADLGVAEEVVERQLQNRERIEAAIRR